MSKTLRKRELLTNEMKSELLSDIKKSNKELRREAIFKYDFIFEKLFKLKPSETRITKDIILKMNKILVSIPFVMKFEPSIVENVDKDLLKNTIYMASWFFISSKKLSGEFESYEDFCNDSNKKIITAEKIVKRLCR